MVRTARDFEVEIPVLRNDRVPDGVRVTVEIRTPPERGQLHLRVGGAEVLYVPRRGIVGRDRFRYRLLTNEGEIGWADVDIEVGADAWMQVGDAVLAVSSLPAPELPTAAWPDEGGAAAFDIDASGVPVGHERTAGMWRGRRWPNAGDPGTHILLPGATSTWLFHAGPGGVVAGASAGAEGRRGFLRRPDGALDIVAAPDVEESVLHGLLGAGRAVGAARGRARFGDDRWHAIVATPGAPWDLQRIQPPPGGGASWAWGASGDVVVGHYEDQGGQERGFATHGSSVEEVHPPGAVASRAYDTEQGWTLGAALYPGTGWRGFLRQPTGTYAMFEVPSALDTLAHGMRGADELAGAFADPGGLWRPFVARPVPRRHLGDASLVRRSPEAKNAEISHACGHTIIGPFVDLEASTTATGAPRLGASHTEYKIKLPVHRGRRGGVVRFWVGSGGPFTFYTYPAVPLRMTAEGGARLSPRYADKTGLCDKIAWLYQFATAPQGRYLLEIGPTDRDSVNVILEAAFPVTGL